VVVKHGVTIIGPVNLASEVAKHASQMYSNNVTTFLKSLVKDGQLTLNLTDEVISGTLVTYRGKVVHPLVRKLAGLIPLEEEEAAERSAQQARETEQNPPPETYRLQG
jgi:NAD(P) transhydrogenase subunit alpha